MASKAEWNKRYMEMAKLVSTWSSCLSRHVGCVITVDRRVVATGYNGAPAGVKSCVERGFCIRKDSKSGENLDKCFASHGEMNAITQAAKMGISVEGGSLYVTTLPCSTCIKLIINAGIKEVYYIEDYNSPMTKSLAEEAGIKLVQLKI